MGTQVLMMPGVSIAGESPRFIGALVLLGAPGAGKGTQAKIVANRYGIPQISTGDLLRENIARDTELGRKAKVLMDQGKLVPDDLVQDMLAGRIFDQEDTKRGFILDGFPRTLPQARWLDRFLKEWSAREHGGRPAGPVVINIGIAYNKLLKRLTGRRSCPTCGRIYNIYFQPPRVADTCDIEGSKLTCRADDSEDVISERLRAYERQTFPLVEYYGSQGRLHEIDGEQPMETVTAEVMQLMEHGNSL